MNNARPTIRRERITPFFQPTANLVLAVSLLTAAGHAVADENTEYNTGDEVWTSETASTATTYRRDIQAKDRSFRLRIRGGVWFTAPSGDVRFGNDSGAAVGSEISVEDGLDLNDAEVSFTGDVTVDFNQGKFKNWQLWFDAFDTSQDASTNLTRTTSVNGTSLPSGTAINSSLSATSFGAHVGYDFFGNLLDTSDNDVANAELRLHALGGLRVLDFKNTFNAPGAGVSAKYDDTHLIGELGGRISILIDSPRESNWGDLDISLSILGGYGFTDGSLTTVDFLTAVTYYPVDHIGLTFGYRLFNINLDDVEQDNDRDYEFDAYLAGIFVGAQITF